MCLRPRARAYRGEWFAITLGEQPRTLALRRSRKSVRTRLEKNQTGYIMRRRKRGRRTPCIAEGTRISQRRVQQQQLRAEYRAAGSTHTPRMPGRPGIRPAKAQTDAVLASHREMPAGVTRTAKRLRQKGTQTSHDIICRIMKGTSSRRA